jgi:hypothetical protein
MQNALEKFDPSFHDGGTLVLVNLEVTGGTLEFQLTPGCRITVESSSASPQWDPPRSSCCHTPVAVMLDWSGKIKKDIL